MHKRASEIARRLAPLATGGVKCASPFKAPFFRFSPASETSVCYMGPSFLSRLLRFLRLPREVLSYPTPLRLPLHPPQALLTIAPVKTCFRALWAAASVFFFRRGKTSRRIRLFFRWSLAGFKFMFHQTSPGVLRKTTQTLRDPSAHLKVLEEILSLISKKALVQVADRPDLCLSPIFVIPKRTGGL